MYAVFQAGGHQYKAQNGDVLTVDKIEGNEGDKVSFDKVLMLGGKKVAIGTPLVSGAKVTATIKKQFRDNKVLVFKYKRRKNYKKLHGHKQPLTSIEINEISG